MNLKARALPGAFLVVLFALSARALAAPLAFENVHVLPMNTERVLENQTVLIDDGRIVAVGEDVDIPEGATRIAGKGRFLMPGLTEMHAHVPRSPASVDRVMSLFLVNGVTTVRGMLGAPSHLELREEIASGKRLAPRLVTSGPSLNGNSVSGAAAARVMVERQAAAGYDFLKLHPGLSLAEFDAIVDAASDAGLDFAGHVSSDVGLERTLAAGQDCIDHLDGYMQVLVRDGEALPPNGGGFFGVGLALLVDPEKIERIAHATAEAGVWNAPTQTLIENIAGPTEASRLAGRPAMRYMPVSTVADWVRRKDSVLASDTYDAEIANAAVDVRRRLIKALHDAGAGLLLGSDAPQVFNVPGFATHDELAVMVAAGLTPFEALETGTVNAARYFGEEGRFGVIAAGAAADLVLLEENPLEDIAHTTAIAGVVRGGRWLDREELDAILARFEQD